MTCHRRPKLALRLVVAMALVVGVGGLTLLVAVNLVAPGLFHQHLSHFGMMSPQVTNHAEQAFASSFTIAITVAMVASLLAAVAVSWFLVRHIAGPVEELAAAAELVAGGNFQIEVPEETFAAELHALATSFANMADRLAAADSSRTRLLSDLAHELRTPLATLEAYIDGLEDGVVPADAAAYEVMRDQVGRLRRLASDVRETADADSHSLHLEPVLVDVTDLVDAATAAMRPRFVAKGVGLEVSGDGRPLPVAADPGRIGQVLANLLDNALRHTPPTGNVSVHTTAEGGTVRIRVTDDGEGIPADQLTAIFERFYRVDRSRRSGDGSGSGLGLTIARAIVTDHHGTIEATSDGPGSGTTFTITLPRLDR